MSHTCCLIPRIPTYISQYGQWGQSVPQKDLYGLDQLMPWNCCFFLYSTLVISLLGCNLKPKQQPWRQPCLFEAFNIVALWEKFGFFLLQFIALSCGAALYRAVLIKYGVESTPLTNFLKINWCIDKTYCRAVVLVSFSCTTFLLWDPADCKAQLTTRAAATCKVQRLHLWARPCRIRVSASVCVHTMQC